MSAGGRDSVAASIRKTIDKHHGQELIPHAARFARADRRADRDAGDRRVRAGIISVEAGHHLKRFLELRADDREGRFAYATFLALDGNAAAARRTLEALAKLYEIDDNLKGRIAATLKDLPSVPAAGG